MTWTLGNCPYRDAVRENQEVVCTLHRGLTRGLLDIIYPNAKLTSFVPRDPDAAGCLVEVRGPRPEPEPSPMSPNMLRLAVAGELSGMASGAS